MARYSRVDNRPVSRYRRIMADKYAYNEIIPWWKVPVKRDIVTYEYTVAPIGFHFVFRLMYNAWLFIKLCGIDTQRYWQEQISLRRVAAKPEGRYED